MLSPSSDHRADDVDEQDKKLAEVDDFAVDELEPAPPLPPPPAAALLDDADLDKCSREDLRAMLRDLLADRVRLLRRHSRTVDQLGARLRNRADELRSLRLISDNASRENAELKRLLDGVESERLRLMDTGRQWQVLAGQSGSALSGQLADLRDKVASLERLLGQLDAGRRLPADGQEEAAAGVAGAGAVDRRLDSIEAGLTGLRPAEALMLRHLLILARQKVASGRIEAPPTLS